MGVIWNLRKEREDARTFGASFLRWRLARPDHNGVVKAKTRFGDIHFRPRDTDLSVLRQVFMDGEYDFGGLPQMEGLKRRYEQMLARGETPVVIDAGANIGAASIWFSRLYPQARIAAVEPDPQNAELARLNTAALANVRVFEAAIGATSGGVKLVKEAGHAWGVRTERSEQGLPVVTVPDLVGAFAGGRLFIAKIDIEGFEADLFSENVGWLDEAAAIIIEPHDWMLPGAGTSQSFQKALVGQGREILIVRENLVFV